MVTWIGNSVLFHKSTLGRELITAKIENFPENCQLNFGQFYFFGFICTSNSFTVSTPNYYSAHALRGYKIGESKERERERERERNHIVNSLFNTLTDQWEELQTERKVLFPRIVAKWSNIFRRRWWT